MKQYPTFLEHLYAYKPGDSQTISPGVSLYTLLADSQYLFLAPNTSVQIPGSESENALTGDIAYALAQALQASTFILTIPSAQDIRNEQKINSLIKQYLFPMLTPKTLIIDIRGSSKNSPIDLGIYAKQPIGTRITSFSNYLSQQGRRKNITVHTGDLLENKESIASLSKDNHSDYIQLRLSHRFRDPYNTRIITLARIIFDTIRNDTKQVSSTALATNVIDGYAVHSRTMSKILEENPSIEMVQKSTEIAESWNAQVLNEFLNQDAGEFFSTISSTLREIGHWSLETDLTSLEVWQEYLPTFTTWVNNINFLRTAIERDKENFKRTLALIHEKR